MKASHQKQVKLEPKITFFKGRRYVVIAVDKFVLTLQRCDKDGKIKPKGRTIKVRGTLNLR